MKNDELNIYIEHDFPNWNKYIELERRNKYAANNLKQQEKKIVHYSTIGKKYKGEYPVEMYFRVHFKDHRRDLDNARLKGVIDGLVTAGVINNDNLNCIQKIVIEPVFDNKVGVEIKIRPLEKKKKENDNLY